MTYVDNNSAIILINQQENGCRKERRVHATWQDSTAVATVVTLFSLPCLFSSTAELPQLIKCLSKWSDDP